MRADVYRGNVSRNTNSLIWQRITELADEVNTVMAWQTNNKSGFELQTFGENRYIPIDVDGLRLVKFMPIESE